ncbi:MAG: hypothetical protein AAB385_04960, partial [Planctomycetota bacterium]
AAGSNLRKLLRRLAAALIPWLRFDAELSLWLRIAVRTDGVMLEPTPSVAGPRPWLRLCA